MESREEEFDLIPKSDVKTIKKLLKKIKRTEDDWTVIKDILHAHSLLVIAPMHDKVETHNHLLVDDGNLIAFTNFGDASAYYKDFVRRKIPEGTYLEIGSLPFDEALDTADEEGMELYIDPPVRPDMFLKYANGRITAAMLFPASRKKG